MIKPTKLQFLGNRSFIGKGMAKMKPGEKVLLDKSAREGYRMVTMNDSKRTIREVPNHISDSQARSEWAKRTEAKMKF